MENLVTKFIKNLTLTSIQKSTTAKVFPRGVNYYEDGYVLDVFRSDDEINASVGGSESSPYLVTIAWNKGVLQIICTCSYDFEGYCKHIIAVLLFCLHEHENIEYQDSLEKKLKLLAKKHLVKIVISAARSHRDTRELILELLDDR